MVGQIIWGVIAIERGIDSAWRQPTNHFISEARNSAKLPRASDHIMGSINTPKIVS